MPFIEHKFFIHSRNINFFLKKFLIVFGRLKIIYLLSRKSEEGRSKKNWLTTVKCNTRFLKNLNDEIYKSINVMMKIIQ